MLLAVGLSLLLILKIFSINYLNSFEWFLLKVYLPLFTNLYNSWRLLLLKGCLPSAKTKTTTPKDQTSTFSPKYYFELNNSGAIKLGVPQIALSFLVLLAKFN